jgi:tripartite-type tricarboxylate transporter receptor subunit TctC
MRKRFYRSLLCTVLAVSTVTALTACGNGSANSSTATTTATSTTTASTTTSAAAGETADIKAAWPNGEVTVYVPANAGGGSDTAARFFTEKFKELTGENFIVVNDTTGANSVAYETVRNAKPDGQTIMIYHGGMCSQYASGQYAHSLADEFTIMGAVSSPDTIGYGIWVNGNSQFETLDDLIAYAKEHPGELTAGVETNNSDHLLCAMFQEQFGIELTVVSAGSNTEKLPLLMGGNLDICFFNPTGTSDYHDSGDLRCLCLMGTTSSELLPDVPTFGDLGYEPIVLTLFNFIAGPKGISDDVCEAVNAYVKDIFEEGTVKSQMDGMGMYWNEYYTVEGAREMVADMENNFVQAYKLLNE